MPLFAHRQPDRPKENRSIARPDEATSREDRIAQAALRRFRAVFSSHEAPASLDDALCGIEKNGLRRERVTEMIVSDRHDEAMSALLSRHARGIALERVRASRGGASERDLGELPSLHRSQTLSFKGREITLNLGSRGAAGRNIVALPKMEQTSDGTIRLGRGAQLTEVDLDMAGAQTVVLPSQLFVAGAANLHLKLAFSDEREDLREAARAKRKEQLAREMR